MNFEIGKNYTITLEFGEFIAIQITEITDKTISGYSTVLSTAISNNGATEVTLEKFKRSEIEEAQTAPYSPEEYAVYELENNPYYQRTTKRWGRVGMSFEVNEHLWNKDPEKAVIEAIQNGKAILDGETYFPEEAEENDEEEEFSLVGAITFHNK